MGLDDHISCGTLTFIKVDRTEGVHAASLQAAVSALNLAPSSERERVAKLSATLAISAFQKQSFTPVRKAEFGFVWMVVMLRVCACSSKLQA